MKRRHFLQLPLASVALTSLAAVTSPQERPPQGFKVESGKARYQEELLVMGGRFQCKVSSKDTGGDLCIYDTFREEKGGPSLHIHHMQDEWFYAVQGEFLLQVGENTFHLRPGDSAFGPRKVPHTFAKINEGLGHMLIVWQPAGSIEDFFYQMSQISKNIPASQEEMLKNKKLGESHGIEIVGPPLKI